MPHVISALKRDAVVWASEYNMTDVDTDAKDIVVGGHSAGGRAAFKYAHTTSLCRALASYDPFYDSNEENPDTLPRDYLLAMPQLIVSPKNSGCSSRINESNNGIVESSLIFYLLFFFLKHL